MRNTSTLVSIALLFTAACSLSDAQEVTSQNTTDVIDEGAREKIGTIPQALTTADYDAGGIIYTNCSTQFADTSTGPGDWAISTCPSGKILAGWNCYWSVNSEQNEEIMALPNQIQCRYRNKGTNATAIAMCCNLEVK